MCRVAGLGFNALVKNRYGGFFLCPGALLGERRQDLQRWSQVMMPTYHATKLLLEILRSNQRVMICKTQKANYEHTSLAKNIHLLTIEIPQSAGVLPEVSANKYFTHIRFVQANQESMRGKPVEKDLEFKMMICSFDSEAVA